MANLTAMFNPADKTTPGYYGPSQTALLLLDFHSMFVNVVGGPPAREALKVSATMRGWAKSQSILVIHALNDINTLPFETCKDADKIAGFITALKSEGGREAIEVADDTGEDATFTRRAGHVSALRSPGLEEFLQENGIKSLILAGLSTSGCVLNTAIAASGAEYVVSVISDGCADLVEGKHELVVEKILSDMTYVATATDFQEGFASAVKAD